MTLTQDWTSMHFGRWMKKLAALRGLPNARVLELGCYEGRATVWLLDNVFNGPGTIYTAVDTFKGGGDHVGLIDFEPVRDRFMGNIAPYVDRVQVLVATTAEAGCVLRNNYFDFVYVDASHVACDVLADCVLAHRVLKPGGLCICDDYGWPGRPGDGPKEGIDAFLKAYGLRVCDVEIAYQCDWNKV